jgi:hypothetical protein
MHIYISELNSLYFIIVVIIYFKKKYFGGISTIIIISNNQRHEFYRKKTREHILRDFCKKYNFKYFYFNLIFYLEEIETKKKKEQITSNQQKQK